MNRLNSRYKKDRRLRYNLSILISFFYTPESPPSIKSDGRQAIGDLAYFLFTIPWWGKLLSIIVGILWILSRNKSKEINT
jgi:hypothetical protein